MERWYVASLPNSHCKTRVFSLQAQCSSLVSALCLVMSWTSANLNHHDSIAILILPVDVAHCSPCDGSIFGSAAQRLPKLPHTALTTSIAPRLTPNRRGSPRKRLSRHLRRVCADRIMECASHQPYAILASVCTNDIRVTTASSHDAQHVQLELLWS